MQSWIRIKDQFKPDCLTFSPVSRFAVVERRAHLICDFVWKYVASI